MRKRQRYDPFADTSRDPLSSKLPRPTGGAAAARWGGSSDLSQELHALADYVAPSPEEDRARHDLVERLRDPESHDPANYYQPAWPGAPFENAEWVKKNA